MYKFWGTALEYLQGNMAPLSFSTFIQPLYIHHIDEDAGVIYLAWPMKKELLNHVSGHYLPLIENAINSSQDRRYRVAIKTEKELNAGNLDAYPTIPQKDPSLDKENLFNPKFTFDNFVVGNSNRFAHAVSLAVAETPGEIYNPLFIWRIRSGQDTSYAGDRRSYHQE